MKCQKIGQDLVAYYYKELEPAESNMIEEHLKTCQLCRQALAELEKTLALIDQKGEVTRSEEFWEAYTDKVYRKIEEDSFLVRLYRDIFIQPKLAPVLATSLLLICLVISSSLYLVNKNKRYEELQLAQGIELFEDYEVIQDLDVINQVDFLRETNI